MSPIWQVMTRIKRQRVGRLVNSLLEMHLQYPLTAQSITMASFEINHHLTLINGRKSNNRAYIWKWLISRLIPKGKTLSWVVGDRVKWTTSLPSLPWRNYYSNSEPRNRCVKQEDVQKVRFVFLNQFKDLALYWKGKTILREFNVNLVYQLHDVTFQVLAVKQFRSTLDAA